MSWGSPDDIDRTGKILVDSGVSPSPSDAERALDQLVLQIAVGEGIGDDPAAQAALATAVNVGRRAFHGGVQVCLDVDPALATGWTAGHPASAVVARYGGSLVDELRDDFPTLVIGRARRAVGRPLLYCTWNEWTGAVVEAAESVAHAPAIVPAGILAAALGVSEAFQQALRNPVPGRRDVGISLWRPDQDWRSAEPGPPLEYLPASMWLLGLGHLGQAYAWTVGMLPYAEPGQVEIGLVDFDTVVKGNTATQLLVTPECVGLRKTRVVAAALEGLGLRTRIVERGFDADFHPVSHANPTRNEPRTALAGFDNIGPRRDLGKAGFDRIVDAGLGAGPTEYLDMVLHTFPAAAGPASAFLEDPRTPRVLRAAYDNEVARQVEAGVDEEVARCGMLDVAGVTVGAAFVGAVASTLVVADVLRLLHGGENYSVTSLDLRDPARSLAAVPNREPGEAPPPPYTTPA